ncbi:RrF2 family transcriptional regulator [Aureibacillus halotolerans]|uniref:BadM/Rrf2 family transcriptional regulator n=1 Tax=Aureibacillus halotolerans TaxID=1508390 RepID=A0A4R6TSZ5_9BACI|nr:RrF2 family transcriptional regulator [Aureibacillus halotolerans]TDQ34621.1 BadM/Rrf2 family transcriptional regulator [Aureibacillus halotolerans]
MKYSKATNYALHTMLFLVAATPNKPVTVVELAEKQKVSPTYLSKILTKLVKAGMIESASGAKGGYRLKRNWENISFLDIIHAIEGPTSMFDCSLDHGPECPIQKVVLSAEEKMEQHLRDQTMFELVQRTKVNLW